jgi:hypothetical protein
LEDKLNKRIRIHRAERADGQPQEGTAWHGPYASYDEALGQAIDAPEQCANQLPLVPSTILTKTVG